MHEGFDTDRSIGDGTPILEYDIDADETVVQAVIHAVTDVSSSPSGERPAADGEREALPSLYDAVDPDALASLTSNSSSVDLTVSFPYAGYEVTVTGTDTVRIREQSLAVNSVD